MAKGGTPNPPTAWDFPPALKGRGFGRAVSHPKNLGLQPYPWTTLVGLKGDQQVIRKLEETEKLIDKTTFVFKVFKDEEASRAKLFQFTTKGSEREYELGKWERRDYTTNGGLSINVAKFGESSYKLTPEAPLSPGEYALTLGPTIFTFSVGAPGK